MSRGVGLDVVDIVDDGVEYADRVGVFVVCVGVVYCGFGDRVNGVDGADITMLLS